MKIYDVEDIKKLKDVPVNPVNPNDIPEPPAPGTGSGTSSTASTASTSADTSLDWDWLKTELAIPDAVFEFLKSKLLANEAPKAKRGSKNPETKFLQLIVLEPAFSTEKYPASVEVKTKLGAADGNYGPNTATAMGMFFDSKRDTEHTEVVNEDVQKLAKFCKTLEILVPPTQSSVGLEELWKRAQGAGGGGGGTGTSGGAGTSGGTGASGFIYVNKPGAGAPAAQPATTTPAAGQGEASATTATQLENPANKDRLAADSTLMAK
jgi:hypothetical protein